MQKAEETDSFINDGGNSVYLSFQANSGLIGYALKRRREVCVIRLRVSDGQNSKLTLMDSFSDF